MGFPKEGDVTSEKVLEMRADKEAYDPVSGLGDLRWEEPVKWQFSALKNVASPYMKEDELVKRFRNSAVRTVLDALTGRSWNALSIRSSLKRTGERLLHHGDGIQIKLTGNARRKSACTKCNDKACLRFM